MSAGMWGIGTYRHLAGDLYVRLSLVPVPGPVEGYTCREIDGGWFVVLEEEVVNMAEELAAAAAARKENRA